MFHSTFQSGVISILSSYGSHPLQLWELCMDQQFNDDSRDRDCGVMIRRIRPNNEKYGDDGNTNKEVDGPAIEIISTELSQNYLICPPKQKASTPRPSLGITLPYLYLTIHIPNEELDFSFEVTVLDDKQTIRRFRASTYQSTTVIKPDICTMPLKMEKEQRRLTRDALLFPAKRQKVDSNDGSSYAECNSYDNGGYYGPGSFDGENDEDDNNGNCWNRLCIPLAEYTKRAYGTNYVETMWVQIHANCRLKRVYFAEKEMDEDDELPEEYRLYH